MFSKATPMLDSPHHAEPRLTKAQLSALTIGCIGVAYGDIGTSPLYAFREAAKAVSHGGPLLPLEIYGILSIIIWSVTLIVTLKYILFLLRVDNRGEGGSLSLMALALKATTPGKRDFSIVLGIGMVGAALFYSDAAITPAISVLSAVEGINLMTEKDISHVVLPLAIILLLFLFSAQKRGTQKVSLFFGPVMCVWFMVLSFNGIIWILKDPSILKVFNPWYAINFLIHHGEISLIVLGAAFLSVTGAESLYADLGHFGRKPIQIAWLILVFPALILNYIGQGSLLLSNPTAIENPFYLMVTDDWLIPMVLLSTLATIIASQAVITGAYSLTRQAIQLGLLPRLEIRHTSESQEGQIYLPKINRLLLLGVLFLCVVFKSSSALASAYGIAVTGTMIVSSMMAFYVMWRVWGRNPVLAACLVLPFLLLECVFLTANMLKVFEGGIVPLACAAMLTLLMYVWVAGTRYLRRKDHRQAIALTDLMERLERETPARVPGTAIFLTSSPHDAPIALIQNLKHNKCLHEHNVVLTIINTEMPKISDAHRIVIDPINSSMTRVLIHFGYMETPDVPKAIHMARVMGLDVDPMDSSYFLGKRSIISDPKRGLPEWQDHIYIALARAAASATDFYRIPSDKVVELGIQITV